MAKLSLLAVAVLVPSVIKTEAFVPNAACGSTRKATRTTLLTTKSSVLSANCVSASTPAATAFVARPTAGCAVVDSVTRLYAAADGKEGEDDDGGSSKEAVFVPDEEDEESLEKVESFGKGAAKAKRGKRKGSTSSSSAAKATASLTPEEVFYEGPPAITETIIPTISIITVVGIIPAAAAWARQAWVRYKITTRRIRVTSGIGGNEMAEIVYPDIVELRTAKRLFGDGDLVAFLRDGAKFEMRNVPNFDETVEFILKQVSKDVAAKYREKGDVTKP